MIHVSKRNLPLEISTLILTVLEFISFLFLSIVSIEQSENVSLVLTFVVITFIVELIAVVFDKFKAVSLVAFALSVVSFFMMLGGRMSYLMFFFTGDVLGTGLSLYFLTFVVFALASIVINAMLVFRKRD